MKDKIIEKYNRVHNDEKFQNLIAQSYSRSVLRDVNEPPENFPNYDELLDSKLINVFQMYFNVALSIDVEETDLELIEIRNNAFKNGADILKDIYYHGVISPEKDFYILISSMAYYNSGDFSKSYAVMKSFNYNNPLTKIVSLYLKKQFRELYIEILPHFNLSDYEVEDEVEADSVIYLKLLAISMNNFLNYLITGEDGYIESAIENVGDLVELAEIDNDILAWYIFKLLNHLFNKFYKVSLWRTIPPLIDQHELVEKYIVNSLFNSPSVVELFPFQIEALSKSMNPTGAVLALPTSSGKTKIAEINILKTLIEDPNSIILYIAPFKSLAYEVEDTFEKSLGNLGISISNMYGDGTESIFDEFLQNNSRVLIVTPEKAKMIIRNDRETRDCIKLVVLDEGHLIGGDLRFTRNEIFYEELKYYVSKIQGKFLVLSAVLPNTPDIAKWLTFDSDNEYVSTHTLNEKRFGVLICRGNNVNLKWKGDGTTFNNNFIENIRVSAKSTLPRSKREAIILSALKFANSGKVLIYLARKDMVKGYIQNFSLILEHMEDHSWEKLYWLEYRTHLKNYYGEDSVYEKVASKGIIIHHASLPNDLRIATEKLLRYSNPKIIIATSTLAQGVNIGVSTVIIGHYRVTQNVISNSDFKNIIGRAGRSFIDIEGKVLFAIDGNQGRRRSKWEEEIFDDLIDGASADVVSGIYHVLKKIHSLAIDNNVSFETLLEAISNNNSFENDCNLYILDDTLLALLNEEQFEVSGLESFINNSFATLIAKNKVKDFDEVKIKEMIVARANYIKTTYQNSEKKELYLQSGIALSFIKLLEEKVHIVNDILIKENYMEELILFIVSIANSEENLYRSDKKNITQIQVSQWIAGEQLNEELYNNFNWGKLYYELPLIINTFSKICTFNQFEESSSKLLEFNECLKYGVPNLEAVKIYLIGLSSREVATKIAAKYYDLIRSCEDRLILKLYLFRVSTDILKEFQDTDLFSVVNTWFEDEFSKSKNKKDIFSIRIKNIPSKIDELRLIEYKATYYLTTLDFKQKYKLNVNSSTWDDKEFSINNLKYSFKRDSDDTFSLKVYGR